MYVNQRPHSPRGITSVAAKLTYLSENFFYVYYLAYKNKINFAYFFQRPHSPLRGIIVDVNLTYLSEKVFA